MYSPDSSDKALLDQVNTLAQQCQERAVEIEQARNLPIDIAESMSDMGVFALLAPQCYGGIEAVPMLGIHILETLARYEASSAWCAMIGMTSAQSLGFLPPEHAKEVFSSPDVRICGVYAPRGTATQQGDELRVQGHWQWGSGTRNAHWVLAGCRVVDASGEQVNRENGAPFTGMALVKAADVTWDDNWHTLGLCGTGSSDFRVDDAVIPQGRLMDIMGRRVVDAALYRFPQLSLLASGIAAVALGIGQGALDESIEICKNKVRRGSNSAQAKRPSVQLALGEMHGRLQAARCWLYDCLEVAWEASQEGKASNDMRRDIRLACNVVCYTAVDAVQLAYRQAGGDSVYKTVGLERRLRDVNVITQHIQVSPNIYEQGGLMLFDLPAQTHLL